MDRKILFASHNRGKYDELAKDFKDAGLDLVYYSDVGLAKLELPEDYEILAENAKEKAQTAAKATGYYTLGDDSGVFIESLDWFPGVHSRRWSGSEEDDIGRNERILRILGDEANRTAYLVSRFSLSDPEGNEVYRTVVKNVFTVSDKIRGEAGFGYDSILLPGDAAIKASSLPEDRKKELLELHPTVAELSQDEKNAINNRGRIALEIKSYFDQQEKIQGLANNSI